MHASMFLCVTLKGKRSIDICAPLDAISNISVLCVLNFFVTHRDEFWLVEVDKDRETLGEMTNNVQADIFTPYHGE